MPNYRAIANSEVDAESPINTALMAALRDNPLAIAEGGENGAPFVEIAALRTVTVGDHNIFIDDVASYTDSNSFVKVKEYRVPRNGDYRFRFTGAAGPGSSTSGTCRLYKNGVYQNIEFSGTNSEPGFRIADLYNLMKFDLVQVYSRKIPTGGTPGPWGCGSGEFFVDLPIENVSRSLI